MPVEPAANAVPVAADVSVSTPESKAVTFNPVAGATDADGDAVRAILTAQPPHGALYVNNDGTYTYTPDPKFVGVDAFTYVVSDGKAVSTPVTASVTVRPAAPVYSYPTAETTTAGTRGGSMANVRSSDGVVETVREVISSGADVDQRYTFTNVPAGTDLVLGLNAWRSYSNPGTGDEYHPQYSTNGSTWVDLTQIVARSSRDVTRTRTDADEPYQMWSLPATVSGTVYVRLTDVNTSGTETVDTLTVDEIFLRSGVGFPTVSVTAATNGAETAANDRPVTFTVTRTGSGASIRNPLTVAFDLSGTAVAGEDYAAPAGYNVTIPAGATSGTFSVTPINDAAAEGAETVALALRANGAYDVGAAAGATATIADNVPDTAAPTAPALSSPIATTSKTAKPTWAAAGDNVGVTAYDVYRGGTLVATVGGTTLSYTDSGLAANTSYAYTVTARDAAGNVSAASRAVTATTRLAAPTNLAVTKQRASGSKYNAKLTWADATVGETGFHVYSSRDGVNWSLLSTTAANATSYTTATLASGTWYFKVAGFNGNGDSDASNTVSLLI